MTAERSAGRSGPGPVRSSPTRVRLGADGYRRLVSGTEILARDEGGPKVFLTVDRKVLKRFRPRRVLSSYWIDPYVYRFVRATRDLAAAGFVTVNVERIYCLGLRRGHLIEYPFLPGESVADLLASGDTTVADRQAIVRELIKFLVVLHERGVDFHGGHVGNFLRLPTGSFALIDVTDYQVKAKPIAPSRREYGVRRIFDKHDHRALLDGLGWGADRAVDEYRGHVRAVAS